MAVDGSETSARLYNAWRQVGQSLTHLDAALATLADLPDEDDIAAAVYNDLNDAKKKLAKANGRLRNDRRAFPRP